MPRDVGLKKKSVAATLVMPWAMMTASVAKAPIHPWTSEGFVGEG